MPPIRLVFLVEDDLDDQSLFSEALASVDETILLTMASDPIEALKALHVSFLKPDIIFSDINMPIMDGLKFLRAIRESDKFQDIPFAFLTTSKRETYQTEIDVLENVLFLEKPTNYGDLCEMIRNVILE